MTKKAKLENRQIRKIYKTTGGKKLTGEAITFTQFKHRVQARAKSENLTIRQAAIRERNTESFTSAAERSRTNLLNEIKDRFHDQYSELVKLNKRFRDETGRFRSLQSNLTWSTQYNTYVLGDEYIIDVSNSPKNIFITRIEK